MILETVMSGNPKSKLIAGITAAIAATLNDIVILPKQRQIIINFSLLIAQPLSPLLL